jgi:hypothetical protein
MQTDEFLIEKAKRLYEDKTGWGDSEEWTNQDFVILSEKIEERTGVALSHVTLKRVWGKVKYDSLPNTHTLDTLVQFLGFTSWREFKSQNVNGGSGREKVKEVIINGNGNGLHHEPPRVATARTRKIPYKPLLITGAVLAVAVLIMYIKWWSPNVAKSDYSFSSKKIVSEGVPNSVVFNFDATKSPYDSVVIQQSWDPRLQVKVSKWQHQHTSIYYLPDYYKAKLIVGGKIVSMHRLLIKSNGWLPIVMQDPVPVYFNRQDAIRDGKFGLSAEQIQSRNIKMQPSPPYVLYSNVTDFGEIYSNDFTFETSVRNDYREGAAACQNSDIYILCEGTAIAIPLCAKGCVSNLDLLFTGFFASGRQEDLSAFGVDFSSFVKVKVVSKDGKAVIYINDKPVYTVSKDIIKSKIIGFDFNFQGTGSIDYVKLTNGKVKYDDDF